MSIYRRASTLYVSVTHGNVRVRRSTRAHTKAEAKACEARILVQLQQGVPADQVVAHPEDPRPADRKRKWTLDDCFEKAMRESWSHLKSVNSYHKPVGGSMVRQLGPDKPMDSIEADDLIHMRKRVVQGEIKGSTFNRYMQILSTMINLSIDWGKPVPKVKPLKFRLEESERFRILRDDEEPKLFLGASKVSEEYHDWLVVSLDTGWRPSEGTRLTARDVRLQDREITVWDGKSGSRAVPLTHRAAQAVRRQMRRQMERQTPTLWTYTKDRLTHLFADAKEHAGIEDADLTAYCLRHTTATRLLEAGHDIHVVARWLGHSSITTTQGYAKVLGHTLSKARDSLER